jgi:serine/threonine-protein kinase
MTHEFSGKIIAEKYRIGSYLGTGGDMGDLYDAVHIFTEQRAAVSILPLELSRDKAASERFFAAAKASFRQAHPNLLNVTDFGSDAQGFDYAVYEPVAGESLAAVLAREGRLPVGDAVEVAFQAASGLAAAHADLNVHGNLSPEDLMIDAGPRVKVVGFGAANIFETHPDITEVEPSAIWYSAPEQCSGETLKSEQADVYSLGAMLFQMLAGEPPFTSEKPTDVVLKHIEEPPAPLVSFRKDLPPELEPVVLKALAKNPEMRYRTAREFAADLENIAGRTGTKTAAAAASGSNFWRTAFIGLIGIAVLAAGLIYATSGKKTDPVTQLKPDENGIPVQPISPPTGIEEQNLASMPLAFPDTPIDSTQAPGTMPGGDGYNAWANGAPPPGAPPQSYVPQGGQIVTIDPNNPSQFMPNDSGVILVPVPANTQTKPLPTPKTPTANTATQPDTKPAATPKPAPTKPAAAKTPAPRPEPKTEKPEAH